MLNLHRSPIWFDVIYSSIPLTRFSPILLIELAICWVLNFPCLPVSIHIFLWPDMATVPPTAGTDCVGEDLWGRVIGAGANPEIRTALTETHRLQPPTDGRVHVNWGMIGVFYVFTAMQHASNLVQLHVSTKIDLQQLQNEKKHVSNLWSKIKLCSNLCRRAHFPASTLERLKWWRILPSVNPCASGWYL